MHNTIAGKTDPGEFVVDEHANVENIRRVTFFSGPLPDNLYTFVSLKVMQLDQPKKAVNASNSILCLFHYQRFAGAFYVGIAGLLVLDANKISDYVKEHIQLNVYLQDDINQQDLNLFLQALNESDFVRSTRYVSKEEALDSLKKELGEGAMGMIDNNPLPATIDINLKASYANSDSLQKIKEQLSSIRLVREVAYQQTEIKKMNEGL
ncbi:MAG: hypothetical protein IPN88_14445 [Bacteroidetes bacterium]|nr:hypothetical protein [Bacteroidota bacterium]